MKISWKDTKRWSQSTEMSIKIDRLDLRLWHSVSWLAEKLLYALIERCTKWSRKLHLLTDKKTHHQFPKYYFKILGKHKFCITPTWNNLHHSSRTGWGRESGNDVAENIKMILLFLKSLDTIVHKMKFLYTDIELWCCWDSWKSEIQNIFENAARNARKVDAENAAIVQYVF
jgi:hypothetical protein